MIPNVRKVSMSPWANQERGAAEIQSDFVFSRKPNPALLAFDGFDPEAVRDDLITSRDCVRNTIAAGNHPEDISTVRHEPQRLFEWGKIAMQVVGGT